jgi:CheY-like chemotaxis protein
MDATVNATNSLSVLVVDDNEDAADSLGMILRVWGYGVRVAYNGKKALEVASTMAPDCILLDINMPEWDGYTVADKIRQRPAMQAVKLVALTAYSDEAHIKKMAQVGFNYYLNKSCTLLDIRRVLETYGESKPSAANI